MYNNAPHSRPESSRFSFTSWAAPGGLNRYAFMRILIISVSIMFPGLAQSFECTEKTAGYTLVDDLISVEVMKSEEENWDISVSAPAVYNGRMFTGSFIIYVIDSDVFQLGATIESLKMDDIYMSTFGVNSEFLEKIVIEANYNQHDDEGGYYCHFTSKLELKSITTRSRGTPQNGAP